MKNPDSKILTLNGQGILIFILMALCIPHFGISQTTEIDSISSSQLIDNEVVTAVDSTLNSGKKRLKRKRKPIPKRAALLSLAPGVGQIYNWKYAGIKVPVIYGGIIGLGIWANDREKYFIRLSDAYKKELAGEPHEFQGISSAVILAERNSVDKTRQQAYISIGILYMVQIVEAYVSAHLIDFDISDDLSFRLKPSFENIPVGNTVGMGVVVEF